MSVVGHPVGTVAGSSVLEDKGAHPLAMRRGELRHLALQATHISWPMLYWCCAKLVMCDCSRSVASHADCVTASSWIWLRSKTMSSCPHSPLCRGLPPFAVDLDKGGDKERYNRYHRKHHMPTSGIYYVLSWPWRLSSLQADGE